MQSLKHLFSVAYISSTVFGARVVTVSKTNVEPVNEDRRGNTGQVWRQTDR